MIDTAERSDLQLGHNSPPCGVIIVPTANPVKEAVGTADHSISSHGDSAGAGASRRSEFGSQSELRNSFDRGVFAVGERRCHRRWSRREKLSQRCFPLRRQPHLAQVGEKNSGFALAMLLSLHAIRTASLSAGLRFDRRPSLKQTNLGNLHVLSVAVIRMPDAVAPRRRPCCTRIEVMGRSFA